MSTMTLSEELQWRGFVNQTTYKDLKALDQGTQTFYHGFDASADSQTVGNLAAMMLDKVFMRHGYKAVLLAGGATSLVGDPGGKDKERPMQDEATIAHNVECAEAQLQKVFAGHDFTLVNNLDWFRDMSVMHFLRDVGKHFSMTPLVQRDYIAKRLGEGGSGISYTEFSYTILQGYDFWHLYKEHGVTLQLSGADQWGNSLSGVDLIRRIEGKEAHVFTCPLIINKATGKKFGKSEEGAMWLDPQKTTPSQFYQFWINADDEGVESYLKVYTELDKPAIDDIMAKHQANKSQRHAQKQLAYEVTKLVHGQAEAEAAQTSANTLKLGMSYEVDASQAITISNDSIVDALALAKLAPSKSEARRLLDSQAVYINDQQVSRDTFEDSDFKNGVLRLRKGKKLGNSVLIKRAQA